MEGMEVMDEREWGDALDERYLMDRAEHEAHAEGNEPDDEDDWNDEPETHLAYNPHTDRHETGGDEIEFADESEYRD